jgi:hypothetical protein
LSHKLACRNVKATIGGKCRFKKHREEDVFEIFARILKVASAAACCIVFAESIEETEDDESGRNRYLPIIFFFRPLHSEPKLVEGTARGCIGVGGGACRVNHFFQQLSS